MEADVAQLQSILPGHSKDELLCVLEKACGNVESALNELLEGGSAARPAPPAESAQDFCVGEKVEGLASTDEKWYAATITGILGPGKYRLRWAAEEYDYEEEKFACEIRKEQAGVVSLLEAAEAAEAAAPVEAVEPEPVDPLEAALALMQAAVPDCCPDHLREQLTEHDGDGNRALEAILVAGAYPKRPKKRRSASPQAAAWPATSSSSSSAAPPPPPASCPSDRSADFWFDVERRRNEQGHTCGPPHWGNKFQQRQREEECLQLLLDEFVELAKPGIVKVFGKHESTYAPAWKVLYEAVGELLNGGALPAPLRKLKCPRKQAPDKELGAIKGKRLREEVAFVRWWRASSVDEESRKIKREAYIMECEANGLLLECECCYIETIAEEVIQCPAGHLFCAACIKRTVECKLGEGEVLRLPCLSTSECTHNLPPAEVKRILPAALWESFQKRCERSNIEAVMQGSAAGQLEQCPFCDFAMFMAAPPEENKIFVCQNEACGKESCRLCREENHIPLRCEEVEKKSQVSHRQSVEERMSEALIRYCPACKRKGLTQAFLKEDGCNKMTCPNKRCRAFSCYVCKEEIPKHVGYAHFCQHARDPGKPCKKCAKCSLWDDKDTAKAEERRVAEEGLNFHREYLAQHEGEGLEDNLTVLADARRVAGPGRRGGGGAADRERPGKRKAGA